MKFSDVHFFSGCGDGDTLALAAATGRSRRAAVIMLARRTRMSFPLLTDARPASNALGSAA